MLEESREVREPVTVVSSRGEQLLVPDASRRRSLRTSIAVVKRAYLGPSSSPERSDHGVERPHTHRVSAAAAFARSPKRRTREDVGRGNTPDARSRSGARRRSDAERV
jgi:hypothetical protein